MSKLIIHDDKEMAKDFPVDFDTIEILGNVHYIPYGKFRYYHTLKNLILHEGISDIHQKAFQACIKLKEIQFPNSLNIIDNEAFCKCENLEYVKLGDNIKYLGDKAFSDCPNLYKFQIGTEEAFLVRKYSMEKYYNSNFNKIISNHIMTLFDRTMICRELFSYSAISSVFVNKHNFIILLGKDFIISHFDTFIEKTEDPEVRLLLIQANHEYDKINNINTNNYNLNID